MKTLSLLLVSFLTSSAFAVEATKKIDLKHSSSFAAPADERNPFWPIGFKPSAHRTGAPSGPVIPASSFLVSSIVLDPNAKFAIINGKTMTEGQTFGMQIGTQIHQVRLKAIQDGRVVLVQQDEEIVVPLRRK